MIIDSQVHAYEANTPKRPWYSVPNWPDHVTGDEMVVAMDKVNGPIPVGSRSSSRSTRTIQPWAMSSLTGSRRRVRSASAS